MLPVPGHPPEGLAHGRMDRDSSWQRASALRLRSVPRKDGRGPQHSSGARDAPADVLPEPNDLRFMKFRVTLIVDATTSCEVEADSKEEALEKAYQKGYPSVCHQCAQELEVNGLSPCSDDLDRVEEISD